MNSSLNNLKTEFIQYLRDGAKRAAERRVGVEIELFGFDRATRERLDNRQVQTVLKQLSGSTDELIFETGVLTEVRQATGGKWTVEPGGQIEFSSAPRAGLHEIKLNLQQALTNLRAVGDKLNLTFHALGFDPLRTLDEQNWFLKPRYKSMKPYLQTRGRRAWDMMTRTCSVQVNLDYENEKDLIRKFVVGNRLAPTVAAIFANSPFADGAPSGFKSTRVAAWLETDVNRCGVSPLALEKEFSLDDFIEYALDVPMLFSRRRDDGGDKDVDEYVSDFTGRPFREFLACALPAPTVADWQIHLTTIFTEVRLKNYLEFRAADAGSLTHALGVAALWKGLLYDKESLHKALSIAPQLTAAEFINLQQTVARNGLQTVSGGINVLNLAKEIVQIAVEGLTRSAPDDLEFLNSLRERIFKQEKSPADLLLENWENSIEKIFETTAI